MNGLTIVDLQELLEKGAFSSEELCQESLARIERLNENGPELRAIIEVNPEAREIAAKMDRERALSGPRSLLHGIPIVIKDNIETADTMQTTAGSFALAGKPAARDACIVEKLRSAGAVIVGKSNLSEWANFRSTKSSSGWSSRGGQCLNPYDLTRSPCGSSSGSAVAVAAEMVAAAIGTETDGSIICPSAMNSVVGIKPTIGSVSRRGIIPIAHSQDTAGPMATCVSDAAVVLDVIRGYDPEDDMGGRYSSRAAAMEATASLVSFLHDSGLRGVRIGVAENLCGFDSRVDMLFEKHLREMERAGAVLVRSCPVPGIDDFDEAELTVLLYEFKDGINRYLQQRGDTVSLHNLDELIAFNREHAATVMPYFGQELFERARGKGSLNEVEYIDALNVCRQKAEKRGLEKLFLEQQIDLLAAPSNGPAWKIDHVNGDRYTGGSSSPAAVSGYPAITLPAGYVFGLPIGTTFIGRPYEERRLIAAAYALEQAYPVRERVRL